MFREEDHRPRRWGRVWQHHAGPAQRPCSDAVNRAHVTVTLSCRLGRGRELGCHNCRRFSAERMADKSCPSHDDQPRQSLRAVWVAGFVCPGRRARSDHLPRRKIPANHRASVPRDVFGRDRELWWLASTAENSWGGLWAAPLRSKKCPRSVRDWSLGIWREH